MAKAKPTEPRIEPISSEEAVELQEIVERACREFTGVFDTLEGAIGMLMIGRLFGWRVLVLIHSKSTIKKYEKILGISIRERFKETGPLTGKSIGYSIADSLGKFWKVVSGDESVPKRRQLKK